MRRARCPPEPPLAFWIGGSNGATKAHRAAQEAREADRKVDRRGEDPGLTSHERNQGQRHVRYPHRSERALRADRLRREVRRPAASRGSRRYRLGRQAEALHAALVRHVRDSARRARYRPMDERRTEVPPRRQRKHHPPARGRRPDLQDRDGRRWQRIQTDHRGQVPPCRKCPQGRGRNSG